MAETPAENTPAERVPTVVADGVDIVYRVNGTGAGRGSATAALNRILRRGKAEKAAGVRRVHAVKNVSFVAYRGEAIGRLGRVPIRRERQALQAFQPCHHAFRPRNGPSKPTISVDGEQSG